MLKSHSKAKELLSNVVIIHNTAKQAKDLAAELGIETTATYDVKEYLKTITGSDNLEVTFGEHDNIDLEENKNVIEVVDGIPKYKAEIKPDAQVPSLIIMDECTLASELDIELLHRF